MIGTHERAAAGVAEDHYLIDSRFLLEPTHSGADVDERMLEQEEGLIASESRVPAEKAVTAGGHEFTQVVLAEIHVVMGCDQRCLRRRTRGRIVQPLTRIEARAFAWRGCRSHRNELTLPVGHGLSPPR